MQYTQRHGIADRMEDSGKPSFASDHNYMYFQQSEIDIGSLSPLDVLGFDFPHVLRCGSRVS